MYKYTIIAPSPASAVTAQAAARSRPVRRALPPLRSPSGTLVPNRNAQAFLLIFLFNMILSCVRARGRGARIFFLSAFVRGIRRLRELDSLDETLDPRAVVVGKD